MSKLQMALEQIAFSRKYTIRLIDATDQADWFRTPPGGITHIGWQVAHLAMAQYRLCLDRVRGRQPGDERIIAEDFLLKYGKDSVPDPDPATNWKPAEIRNVFDGVHQQVLAELPKYSDEELSAPALRPHLYFTEKIGGLFWCAAHEMMHAGQIGLLRRQLGAKPLW